MDSQEKRLNIFGYDDYRRYLRDYYTLSKQEKAAFSFRYFSRLAGFQSPNFLKRVMDGERNLTVSAIEKFVKALKFNKQESLFFKNLVLLNQAKNSEEKRVYAAALLKSQMLKKIRPLHESQFNYYAHWYFVPIREMVGSKNFRDDPAWIAKRLTPPISAADAKRALDELLKLGLIKRDDQGRLVQSSEHLATADQVTSASLAQYHREMARLAGESIDRVERENREISSVTLGMSAETLKKAKELLRQVQVDIVQMATQDSGANRVFQVNFHVFPLTEVLDGGDTE